MHFQHSIKQHGHFGHTETTVRSKKPNHPKLIKCEGGWIFRLAVTRKLQALVSSKSHSTRTQPQLNEPTKKGGYLILAAEIVAEF